MNPITRVKEYIQYQRALESMRQYIYVYKGRPIKKDECLTDDEKVFYNLYRRNFLDKLQIAKEYQAKYCAK